MARVEVNWTEQALDDLDSICLFIARDSPRYARIFAQRAFQATERLADFPESGRIVPEIGRRDIREVILGNYRIIIGSELTRPRFSQSSMVHDF